MVLVLPFLGTPLGVHGHYVQPFPPPGKDGMPPELAALVEHPSQQLHGEQTVEWFDSDSEINDDDNIDSCGCSSSRSRNYVTSALPTTGGEFMAAAEVVGLAAKGDSGALLTVRTKLTHATTGKLVAVLTMGSFIRGLPRGAAAKMIADQATKAGKISSEAAPATTPAAKPPTPVPMRPPDASAMLSLSPTQALLYRLASGDYNPLHADPAVSEHLGLGPKPIVHGLCTLGVASRAIVAASQAHQPSISNRTANDPKVKTKEPTSSEGTIVLGCGGDPGKLRALSGRFVAPAYPGEELEVQLWAGGQQSADDSTHPAVYTGSDDAHSSSGRGSSVGTLANGMPAKRAERHLVHFRVIAQPRKAVVVDFGWALVEKMVSDDRGQLLRPRL